MAQPTEAGTVARLPKTAAALLVLAAALASAAAAPSTTTGDLEVDVSGGRVHGVELAGQRVFRGIPYAAPPVGERRLRPPQPHPGWAGVLEARDFGPSCVQPQCWNSENISRMSEDCLTINVVAPRGRGPFPVMVYIHAGEFRCGTSNDNESNWLFFADDIVYVTFNYRVGAFGFLAAQELRALDPRNGTGNTGIQDQRLALRWVHENIGAFGGDASKVTIWGESSGGTSVAYHLAAAARPELNETGLFQRAILQSPGMGQVRSLADATQNYIWLLAALAANGAHGCPNSPGYVSWADDAFVSMNKSRVPLRTSETDTQEAAEAWCTSQPECAGFSFEDGTVTFVSRLGFQGMPENATRPGMTRNATMHLKAGPATFDQRLACLMGAPAMLLNNLTRYLPRDDTFQTDGWAPVLDGVDLVEPLTDSVAARRLAPGVDMLLGTNLDEGSEFMGLAPPLYCNATRADFQDWASLFYGPAVGHRIVELYAPEQLRRPLPVCGTGGEPSDVPGEQAPFFTGAMRSAGDASIMCPTVQLATQATGRAFLYEFLMTPTKSVNFDNTSIWGAFHGAEVPFAFGAKFELLSPAERALSATMGCYWRSFAKHGDPNVEACPGAPKWPTFSSAKQWVLQLGTSVVAQTREPRDVTRCEAFRKSGFYRSAGGLFV